MEKGCSSLEYFLGHLHVHVGNTLDYGILS